MFNQLRTAVEFAQHLPRYHEIIRVLFHYGFADVLKLVALQKLLGLEDAVLAKHESGILAKPPAERLRLALEELGPTFIKFGQILSSRRDIVNDEFYDELCKLQDQVPTFPEAEARRIFLEDFGVPVEEAFKSFDVIPVAAASISQVHRAELLDGGRVAVKIQRPEIKRLVERDLDILKDLAGVVEHHVSELSSLNPSGLVREFSVALLKELDFTNEAANSERCAAQFEGNPHIQVGKIYREVSSERVLTMEYLSGLSINDREGLIKAGIEPRLLAQRISVLIFQQIFEHGFFHGDPHPGNLTIMPDGVVALYDFGMMGSFTLGFRASIARMLAGLAGKDLEQVRRSILDMSEEGYVENPEHLLRDVEEFSEGNLSRPLSELKLGSVLDDLLELLRRNHLRMKGSFYLGIKALSQVESAGRKLDPELNFVLLGQPYAARLIERKYHPLHLLDMLRRIFEESVDFLEDLPQDFRTVYGKIKRGQLNIPLQHKIDPKGFEPLRLTLDSIANRLTNAIVAASVLIGSSILILAGLPPRIWEVPVIGILGLIWGGYMCLRLVFSIWRHGGL